MLRYHWVVIIIDIMQSVKITVTDIVEKCKTVLEDHYGTRMRNIRLYGSVSRSENEVESDIDLLVVLKGPFDYFQELRTITDLLYPVQLESDYLISAMPAAVGDYDSGNLQLYRNIKREGISV